jgi:hypothetical protein
MSRRIAYLFAAAVSVMFVAPAVADRECFDNTCKMPEVTEAPDAPAQAVEETEVAKETSQSKETAPIKETPTNAERLPPAPEPIRPRMVVDELPRPALKPSPYRPAETEWGKSVREAVQTVGEPIEVISRGVQQQIYAAAPHSLQPGAGVMVVVPGAQYGADGIVPLQGPQDSSWELCQSDRRDRRCGPSNYQPFGAYGYRPLGDYRRHRSAPGYVYVPDAKVIVIDGN